MAADIDKEFLDLLHFQNQLNKITSNYSLMSTGRSPAKGEWQESQSDIAHSNSALKLCYSNNNSKTRPKSLKCPESDKDNIAWYNYQNATQTSLKIGNDKGSDSELNKLLSIRVSGHLASYKYSTSKTDQVNSPVKSEFEVDKEKLKAEEEKNLESDSGVAVKDRERSKTLCRAKLLDQKRKSQEYKKIRDEFYSIAESIIKNWMGFIYFTLNLRTNLVKFTLQQMPLFGTYDINVHRQMLLENECLSELIRDTQDFSDNKFMNYWRKLEKAIFDYLSIKNGVDTKKLIISKIENELSKITNTHGKTKKSYSVKIESLMKQIKETEDLIESEREANARMKAVLTYNVSLELILKIIRKMHLPLK